MTLARVLLSIRGMRRRTWIVVLFLGLLFSRSARADVEEPSTVTRSYAWQTVTADVIGVGVAYGVNPYLGGGLFLVGSPLVHLAHGNYRNAGISAAVRAATAVGAVLFAVVQQRVMSSMSHGGGRKERLENNPFVEPSLLMGAVGAGAVDALALAKETVRPNVTMTLAW